MMSTGGRPFVRPLPRTLRDPHPLRGVHLAMLRATRLSLAAALSGLRAAVLLLLDPPPPGAAVTREEVEQAIRDGVRFLKQQQRADGSWPDVDNEAHTGTTSLVTLALLTAGEPADSPDDRAGARLPAELRPRAARRAPTPSRSRRWSSPRPTPSATS